MSNRKQNEIEFTKYELQGADYHYKQIDKKKFRKFNVYVYTKYLIELRLILKALKKQNNKSVKVLDVGCGDAVPFYLINQKIKNYNFALYGVDTSESALRVAKRRNPYANFRNADVYNLPFENNYFDLIISTDVIEHIKDQKKMLSEIRRVGKTNSIILIGTPIRIPKKPLHKFHFHEFYPKEFQEFLLKFFSNIQIIQSHRMRYMLLYKKMISIPGITIYLFYHLMNFLAIYFKKNPFLKIKTSDNELYSYMFALGKIEK